MIAISDSIGDYLVCFNPETDPYESIGDMVKVAKKSDVVIGVAEYHTSIIYRAGISIAKRFLKYVSEIQSNATEFICISRNAINTILKLGSSSHYIIVNICNLGLSISYYTYKLLPGVKYYKDFKRAISRFFDLLILTSIKPLRIVSMIGFLTGFISFIIAFYAFAIRLFSSNLAVGWSSSIVILSFFFMILFVTVGFLVEYIGRILNELEKHDVYYIYSERTSRVMIKEDRLNILSEAEDSPCEDA
jgi:dolichol-phosphate mannosyltransferase